MDKDSFKYLGWTLKRLNKKIHGREGVRVVRNGKEFRTVHEAKMFVNDQVFPYRHTGIGLGRR